MKANQICQRIEKMFMADLTQNGIHEKGMLLKVDKGMLLKVDKMCNLFKKIFLAI